MADDAYEIDEWGGECRVVGGQEMRAVWVPLTQEEKKALMEKAGAQGTAVGLMVANYLKGWLNEEDGAELSIEDLEQVAGGGSFQLQRVGQLYPSLARGGFLSRTGSQMPGGDLSRKSTIMCPW
jgi:hypothetical protein